MPFLKSLFLLSFAIIFLFFVFSFPVCAGRCSGPLVPCNGLDCTPCHFFAGFSNIINFIVYCLTPPVAALMIVISGLILIFGGTESAKTTGKKMFSSVIIGLIIIYSSWLIVNTIIRVLAQQTEGWVPSAWNQVQCTR